MVKYSCQYIDNALAFNRTDKGSDFSRVTFCNCMNSSNGLGRSPYKENYDFLGWYNCYDDLSWIGLYDGRSKLSITTYRNIFFTLWIS